MLIDGKQIAQTIRSEVSDRVSALRSAGIAPTLAIVVPTDDESSAWYVRSLVRTARKLDIETQLHELNGRADELEELLTKTGSDPSIHGLICQTPLPGNLRLADIGRAIDPRVDIDGANPTSLGEVASGSTTAFPPATAAAVVEILRRTDVPLEGRRVVVIGRSNVVGKPAALLLLNDNATVTVCHSRTVDLPAVAREADVLIAAVGRPHMVTADYVKPGATVIDVGTNPTSDGGLVGDVDIEGVEPVAGAVTPVPGGVGPVTTMVLMRHLVIAAERR
jgi:methylenetetrahydrofolate dehydrogenase (NADP+) / methenyltetrahydrofolate cyclohydrolase